MFPDTKTCSDDEKYNVLIKRIQEITNLTADYYYGNKYFRTGLLRISAFNQECHIFKVNCVMRMIIFIKLRTLKTRHPNAHNIYI